MLGVYWCSGIRLSYSESGCFTPQAGVLAMWPWYTTAAPTYGRLQQSAMISMDETMERGTYEPTNPPQ